MTIDGRAPLARSVERGLLSCLLPVSCALGAACGADAGSAPHLGEPPARFASPVSPAPAIPPESASSEPATSVPVPAASADEQPGPGLTAPLAPLTPGAPMPPAVPPDLPPPEMETPASDAPDPPAMAPSPPAATSGVLAATPPMGWNSWNRFAGNVSEALVRQTADAIVSSGMKAAGYVYVNIDDTWQASRDASGRIQPDPIRFPNGIQALAEYVHGLGLKLGVYSDRGTATCGGRPGSYGYEARDAATYAEWGVDYLKYDNCSPAPGRDNDAAMREDYTRMGEALRNTGRPIVFSICGWWFYGWEPAVGQLWRTTTDIVDRWSGDSHSVLSLINKNGGDIARYGNYSDANFQTAAYTAPGLAQYAGPGHWNDPDMLEVGNGGMTDTEYRSHFSLWAMMAAPLIAGNDVTNMSQATRDILLNGDVIAVDQDPLGIQGRPISANTTLEVWSKPLAGERTQAVVLFNRSEAPADIGVSWQSLGLGTTATVRDLWQHADLGDVDGQFTARVPAHGVVMLKVVGRP